ncbi:MAG: DUF4301 family protein [Bacteroidales bacterium]
MKNYFSQDDLEQIVGKGMVLKTVEDQLECFRKGFPYLKIEKGATIGDGIMAVDAGSCVPYATKWDEFIATGAKTVKFVPASGAASRMFKDLFAFIDAPYSEPVTDFEKKFFDDIKSFAFYNALNEICIKNENGDDIKTLINKGMYKNIANNLLSEKGLNYGWLPKGLLLFHKYKDSSRTAMEEHLVEGAMYAKNEDGSVNIHFTVSGDHLPYFKELATDALPKYENLFGVKYNISFSEQKSETDTIAADENNTPFRDKGKLLFRPGGHGSLIENLNEIDADIIFIKNIDNIVPDSFKNSTVLYKKVLGGVTASLLEKIYRYGSMLESRKYSMNDLREIILFLQQYLFVRNKEIKEMEDSNLAMYLLEKLHRPLRVCGMVKNIGEPGGGPFLAYNEDGTYSPQILESSQINMMQPASKSAFENSTHFNPVDIVCAVKDWNGKHYNLPDFVDKNTGFISEKSKNGKLLKALERPGLWNGAMSDWNTVFVEVPIETFNPVKTVNDLLRDSHLSK